MAIKMLRSVDVSLPNFTHGFFEKGKVYNLDHKTEARMIQHEYAIKHELISFDDFEKVEKPYKQPEEKTDESNEPEEDPEPVTKKNLVKENKSIATPKNKKK